MSVSAEHIVNDGVTLARVSPGTGYRPFGRRASPPLVLARPCAALLLLAVVACMSATDTHGQVRPTYYDFTRPQLEWYTIETEHFDVIFHADIQGSGVSRTAQVVARIAEDVYGPITELYDHEPDQRVAIILKDFEDYSNGAAYFFDNKIEIWAPALDSPLRGDHNWLRNVITHEFTHIVQVQATMKAGRRMPFIYMQWLDYEDVRRPDVLYGYPNVIASYPIATISNPAWLAEGTAQYMRAGLDYDDWDSHRDMLLRTRVLAGETLSLADMGGFYSHTSLLRETVYNQGFAFTRFLAGTYGEKSLADISRALGKWRNWNVERAMTDALGTSGNGVYRAWVDSLEAAYTRATADIVRTLHDGSSIEPEGSHNFHPRFSPDGQRLAYISNRGRDYSATSLYIRNLSSGDVTSIELFDDDGAASGFACSFGHRLVPLAAGSFSWSPDGSTIVFSRTMDTWQGHLYADLYTVDVGSGDRSRLTRDLRAAQPEYSPDGTQIAFIGQRDGTSNLFLIDPASLEMRPLTNYGAGVQVTDPRWSPDGRWIYFGRSSGKGRDVYRVSTLGDRASDGVPVIATDADERSPSLMGDGSTLVYSSDASGIFNLYAIALDDGAPQGQPWALTNVVGGAFMPDVSPDAREIAFSRYEWDGYKIALVDWTEDARVQLATYSAPAFLGKALPTADSPFNWDRLNRFDDSDLQPLPGALVTDAAGIGERLPTDGSPASFANQVSEAQTPTSPEVRPYRSLFTSFSFYPVYRMDRYVGRRDRNMDARVPQRGVGETLLRNSKVGVYASSREILEGITFLGGLLVAPASTEPEGPGEFFLPGNLLRLERDLFMQLEYGKGFGFIPKRWSPQISLEMYNIRRNVSSGLSIEEFPCTACYPDTTFADLAYNLWEANIALRGKVNRGLLLEAAYRFSPYRVTTERFFSREENQTIPASSSRYYIGRTLALRAYLEAARRHRHDDAVPERMRAELSYEFEPGQLLQRFDVEDGLLVPGYQDFRNHRLLLDARIGLRLPGTIGGGAHGLDFRIRGSTILGKPVDDFFDDYVGGLIGARGYPFYALGGNETLWLQAAYNFPIIPRVARQVLWLYVDKVYGRIFADGAMAWSGSFPGLGEVRKDLGAELRIGLGSFYLFPTAVFLSGAYGFDSFDVALNEGFVTADGRTSVTYGQRFQWHFGILFDFDL